MDLLLGRQPELTVPSLRPPRGIPEPVGQQADTVFKHHARRGHRTGSTNRRTKDTPSQQADQEEEQQTKRPECHKRRLIAPVPTAAEDQRDDVEYPEPDASGHITTSRRGRDAEPPGLTIYLTRQGPQVS